MHTKGPLEIHFDGIEQEGFRPYRKAKIFFERENVGNAADDVRMFESAPDMCVVLEQVKDRLTAWRDSAHIVYHQTGSEEAYNQRGNYDGLVSLIGTVLPRKERSTP